MRKAQLQNRARQQAPARPSEDLQKKLLAVRDLLDKRSHEPLDVLAQAHAAGLSRAHFIRAFRAAFGATPHQYLMTRRLERATALLRNTQLRVTDVCFEVGFDSLGSFSSLFRRALGVSPSAYRASQPADDPRVPSCVVRAWTRPESTFREASPPPATHPRPGPRRQT